MSTSGEQTNSQDQKLDLILSQLTSMYTDINMLKARVDDIDQQMTLGQAVRDKPTEGILPTPPKRFAPPAPHQSTYQPPSLAGERFSAPRFHKLEFPKFDGKEDPLPWLNRCEQFFRGQRTPEEDKVWLASYHMLGSAQTWFHRLERDTGTPSWRYFAELVNTRFGPPIRNNALGELALCKRTGTVEDYQERFLSLLCRADPLSERQQTQLFTVGLQEPLRTDVELQSPQSLELAMSLARANGDCS